MGRDHGVVGANVELLTRRLKSYVDGKRIGNFFVKIGGGECPGGVDNFSYDRCGRIREENDPNHDGENYQGSFIFAQIDPKNSPYHLTIDSGTLQENTPPEASENLRLTICLFNKEPVIDEYKGNNGDDSNVRRVA